MKKLLLLSLLVSAFSAQASIMVQNQNYGFCGSSPSDMRALCYTVSTTTSLPTLIVEDVEIDLNSPEAQERLEAEMRGDIEPVLLNQLHHIQGE